MQPHLDVVHSDCFDRLGKVNGAPIDPVSLPPATPLAGDHLSVQRALLSWTGAFFAMPALVETRPEWDRVLPDFAAAEPALSTDPALAVALLLAGSALMVEHRTRSDGPTIAST